MVHDMVDNCSIPGAGLLVISKPYTSFIIIYHIKSSLSKPLQSLEVVSWRFHWRPAAAAPLQLSVVRVHDSNISPALAVSVSVFVSVFVSVSVFVGVFVGVNNIKGQSRLSFVCVFVSVPLPSFQTSMSFSTDGAIINKNFNITSLRMILSYS